MDSSGQDTTSEVPPAPDPDTLEIPPAPDPEDRSGQVIINPDPAMVPGTSKDNVVSEDNSEGELESIDVDLQPGQKSQI